MRCGLGGRGIAIGGGRGWREVEVAEMFGKSDAKWRGESERFLVGGELEAKGGRGRRETEAREWSALRHGGLGGEPQRYSPTPSIRPSIPPLSALDGRPCSAQRSRSPRPPALPRSSTTLAA